MMLSLLYVSLSAGLLAFVLAPAGQLFSDRSWAAAVTAILIPLLPVIAIGGAAIGAGVILWRLYHGYSTT